MVAILHMSPFPAALWKGLQHDQSHSNVNGTCWGEILGSKSHAFSVICLSEKLILLLSKGLPVETYDQTYKGNTVNQVHNPQTKSESSSFRYITWTMLTWEVVPQNGYHDTEGPGVWGWSHILSQPESAAGKTAIMMEAFKFDAASSAKW